MSAYDSHQDKIKPPPHSPLQTSEGLFTSANGATALTEKYICLEIQVDTSDLQAKTEVHSFNYLDKEIAFK